MSSRATRLFPTPGLIGRKREQSRLLNAVDAGRRRIFYLVADGGLGKTFLLKAFHKAVYARDDVLETGLLDLQQERYLQPALLLSSLVSRLRHSQQHVPAATGREFFSAFDLELARYVRSSIEWNQETEESRFERVYQAFQQGYDELTKHAPVVLILDTFEKLHAIYPELEEFNFRRTRQLEEWVIKMLAVLPRTIIVLAGRPGKAQEGAVAQILKREGRSFHRMELHCFSKLETASYVKAAAPELADLASELHAASGGRPVLLSLFQARARIARERGEVYAPPQLTDPQDGQIPASDEFVRQILDDLRTSDLALADLLLKVTFLRKGVSTALLIQLDHETEAKAAERLSEFADLPFAKLIDKTGEEITVALHDELYDLLFDKQNPRTVYSWYRQTIAFIEARLAEIESQFSNAHSGVTPRTLQEFQTLTSHRLYYNLALDPLTGFEDLRESIETAIRNRDWYRDEQLQDDMAAFFDSRKAWGRQYRERIESQGLRWQTILCDEAIRWTERRLLTEIPDEDRYAKTIELLRRIQERFGTTLEQTPLLRARHRGQRLQCEMYTVSERQDVERLIHEFQEVIDELSIISTSPPVRGLQPTVAALDLAYMYNHRGYFRRLQQRIRTAIDDYREAARRFYTLGREADGPRIQTLINLSFALNEQGETDEAIDCAEGALRLAERQGSRHLQASALNTLARIRRLHDAAHALRDVIKARSIFEELGSVRNRALCQLAEGLIRAQLAGAAGYDTEQGVQIFREAEQCFRYASYLLDMRLSREWQRRLEARVNWATVYRERALAATTSPELRRVDFQRALQLLDEAEQLLASGAPNSLRVSILEDRAVIHESLGEYDKGIELMQIARALVPEAYTLRLNGGLSESGETREVQIYWLRLAQVELQTALCLLGRAAAQDDPALALPDEVEGCRRTLMALAYLLTFSREPRPLASFRKLSRRAIIRTAQRRLWRLREAGETATSEGEALGQIFYELRRDTNFFAARYRVESTARAEMERIFRTSENHLTLLK